MVTGLLCACGPSSSAPTPEEPDKKLLLASPKVSIEWSLHKTQAARSFSDGEGVRVEVVPVVALAKPELTDRYLVRVSGIDGEQYGLVFLVRRELEVTTGTDSAYVANIHGEPRTLLYQQIRSMSHWMHRPTNRRMARINLKPQPETVVDAAGLLKLYQELDSSGALEAIAPSDRAGRERAQKAMYAKTMEKNTSACGPLASSIDWSTVEDGWFEEHFIADTCSKLSLPLAAFCQRFPQHIEALRKAPPLVCRLKGEPEVGDSPALISRDSAGGLIFKPGSTEDFYVQMHAELRREFGELDQVFRVGNVYFAMRMQGTKEAIYQGDGTVFYQTSPSFQMGVNYSSLPQGRVHASLVRAHDKWFLACGSERQALELLSNDERDSILANAQFKTEAKWKREPYFLARDSRGTYYYVDRFREGKRYRVFIGRRGQLKLSKLKGIVEDSQGTVFSTASGVLRLLVNESPSSALWIRGKRETPLVTVKVEESQGLIYDELGVYYGQDLGHACVR